MDNPTRYRKKPGVIEAFLFTGRNVEAAARFCGGRVVREASDPTDVYLAVDIPTLEGVMRADRGDYIIRGVKGEFYPCKPDIFHATYESVADNPAGAR